LWNHPPPLAAENVDSPGGAVMYFEDDEEEQFQENKDY
jgi:hypothetical protein